MNNTARRMLMAILMLGVAGVSVELWLLGHTEDVYQLIPVALAVATMVMGAAVSVRPSAGSMRLFQMVMALMIVSAVVGMWLHFQVNIEFQLEMDPSLTGMNLFRKSILAKTPPALAPGTMMQLGLIGLAYTFRHPAFDRAGASGN